jgi:hypothetical protein
MERTRKRRARRWVVEQPLGWLNRSRRRLVRWEKKAENHLAFLSLACIWTIHRAIARSSGRPALYKRRGAPGPDEGPVSKRWGKERVQDDSEPSDELLEKMLGTMIPIAGVGDTCEKRAHMMFPGDSPYEAGFFMGKGWTAVEADNPPTVNFLSPEFFQKEVEQNHVTT